MTKWHVGDIVEEKLLGEKYIIKSINYVNNMVILTHCVYNVLSLIMTFEGLDDEFKLYQAATRSKIFKDFKIRTKNANN